MLYIIQKNVDKKLNNILILNTKNDLKNVILLKFKKIQNLKNISLYVKKQKHKI